MSFIQIISWPFAKLLWLFNFTGSYAVALLLFAIVVKIVLLPMSIKQQKTQIKGAKLRPKMAAIEKKYAGRTDQKTLQKKQQEMMALQQEEGYSPLSGCLPLLIQLPIIIILYNIIQNPLTNILGFNDAFISTNIHPFIPVEAHETQLKTLAAIFEPANAAGVAQIAPDILEKLQSINLNFFGLNMGVVPTVSWSWYLLIPIFTALSSYASMKISRKLMGQNPAMQAQSPETRTSGIIMDLMMPLMSLWFAFKLPALLGLYWIYQSILGVVQQFILSKAMPLPTYTEDEIRAILKAEKEKANANRAAMRQGNYSSKSLHHIDDDDDDDIIVPTIRSKFDDDDTPASPTPSAKPASQKPSGSASHKKQIKKKK
ncbi:MAG: YidC/Oxa1 family membrane protein insertase [Ruminococcaceae bacterium]|nr:YidC/Oxa1 family membrane protein insertase [Oscillospiraceae bacterium]